MLKIRLRRMGNRHRPFYRVVVSDGRSVPTSSAVEEIGYYDPRQSPSLIKIDTERVDHWVGKGAKMSDTVEKLVRKARLQPAEEPVVKTKAAKESEPETETAEAADVAAQAATETASESAEASPA